VEISCVKQGEKKKDEKERKYPPKIYDP